MSGIADIRRTDVAPETLDAELGGWMAEVAPDQWRPVPPLASRATALVVVDMSRPFVDEGRPLHRRMPGRCCPGGRARRGLPLAGASRPVARAAATTRWSTTGQACSPSGGTPRSSRAPPTWSSQRAWRRPRARRSSSSAGYSGFLGTDLELTLRTLGAASVVVCGVLTNVCPFATAMEAFMRGLPRLLPRGRHGRAQPRPARRGARGPRRAGSRTSCASRTSSGWVAALPGR